MPNLLTTGAGLKLAPIVIETFFKHYLERKSENRDEDRSEHSSSLRREDLLWQESFEIVKSFLNQATRHTVEELQEFSNARIPVAPWIYAHRVLVPMSSCDAAAEYLIKALGGEAFTKRVVGGTKWWQVRGMRGVDCQWICQKSHMQQARRRKKTKGNDANGEDSSPASPSSPRFRSFRTFSYGWGTSPLGKGNDAPEDETQIDDQSGDEKDGREDLAGMDGTRCMLYAHGGGYYFGSIDQERYCMQRYARKINGRVFAVNYRLAPQYPFPCAIQDMLAAYLYLIEPPPDATHAPIPPQSIILGGDSAGGGLCLATLQVIRDSGFPLPAAAVLISPWSDLTHSFPSTIQNTDTDIIPPYGLCLHKPSVLWPPPPDEITSRVRAGLRERFKKVARRAVHVQAAVSQQSHACLPQVDGEDNAVAGNEVLQARNELNAGGESSRIASPALPEDAVWVPSQSLQNLPDTTVQGSDSCAPKIADVKPESGHTAAEPLLVAGRLPLPWEPSDDFNLVVDGKTVTVDTQIQLYCPNSLLTHPLVSPALGYLGGLPPLLVIASDKEVLRDEIIYLAHKAAHPDRYPINEDARRLYPPIQNIAQGFRPTPVHLQVYDETAHVLPLFSFTTPAKYCYRAIALFAKHCASTMEQAKPLVLTADQTVTPENEDLPRLFLQDDHQSPESDVSTLDLQGPPSLSGIRSISSTLRSQSSLFKRRNVSPIKRRQVLEDAPKDVSDVSREDSGDIAGNRFKAEVNQPKGPGTAGDPSVYADLKEWPLGENMIRERVSTRGVLRPLEPETEIPALNLPAGHVGRVNEAAARRYLTGQGIWAKKFVKTAKKIAMKRQKNLELARGETMRTVKTMAQFQEHLFREQDALENDFVNRKKFHNSTLSLPKRAKDSLRDKTKDAERHSWGWAWALDGEQPPPSSIVSRRDTVEARNLARVADLSVGQEESKMSGNMLWSVLVNFLTAHPSHKVKEEENEDEDVDVDERPKRQEARQTSLRSKGSRIIGRMKSLGGRQPEQTSAREPPN